MAAGLHTKQLGEPPRGLALRHAPDGSGEAHRVAAALVRREIRPAAGCQVDTARSAWLAA
jgi:hypothetical protein